MSSIRPKNGNYYIRYVDRHGIPKEKTLNTKIKKIAKLRQAEFDLQLAAGKIASFDKVKTEDEVGW